MKRKVTNMKNLKHHRASTPHNSDPLAYCINSSQTILALFAIDMLSVPSCAPVERTFSAARIATSGRRNRLAKDNLENEILLEKNEQYFAHIYWSSVCV